VQGGKVSEKLALVDRDVRPGKKKEGKACRGNQRHVRPVTRLSADASDAANDYSEKGGPGFKGHGER